MNTKDIAMSQISVNSDKSMTTLTAPPKCSRNDDFIMFNETGDAFVTRLIPHEKINAKLSRFKVLVCDIDRSIAILILPSSYTTSRGQPDKIFRIFCTRELR